MTMDREVTAEKRMRKLGRERAERVVQRAADTGNYSTVAGGNRLLSEVVLPLAKGITEYLMEVHGGGASTRTQAAPLLCQVEANVAAYLTASSVINSFASKSKLASVATTIGSRMEDEVRFSALKEGAPALYATLQKSFEASHSQSEHYRKRVLAHYTKTNRMVWEEWTATQQARLGLKLIDLMVQTTGMIEIETSWVHRANQKPRSVAFLTPTQAALDVVHEVNAQLGARPYWLPTVVQPKHWDTPTRGAGGYHFLNYPLVQSRSRAFQEELAAADMPDVLRAVNAMQDTAWSINCDVLAVVLDIWESSHDVEYVDEAGKVHAPLHPRAVLEELPPINAELEGDALKAHKRVRKAIHERNLERRRHAVEAALTVGAAVEYAAVDSFFFPQFLDFRGRCYPRPGGLNPQSHDLAKGVLTFADAVPLGASGVEWLAIHGANSWGIDKVSLEDRIQWTSNHWDEIRAYAADPMENRGWMAADSPFVFLAFCFEWAKASAYPGGLEAYPSSLPVGVDGSCNGLQHFSAMLRDPVGGAAVNLVPDTTPHDVYGEVLAAVEDALERIAVGRIESMDADKPRVEMAHAWLHSGLLVRDLVKRPTMTLPYGCTKKGVEAMLMDDVVRPAIAAGTVAFPEDASGWRHVNFLANVVWDAMGTVVIAARAAMGWLQAVSDAASAADVGAMVWHTPLGFPVRHLVLHEKVVIIQTVVGGKRLTIKLREDSEKVDKGGMRRGISPNFVHALDATHLYSTVCGALDAGITSFAMVHDSYGTQAGNVDTLSRILRANFVELYSNSNPMEDLAASLAARGVEVPPLPPRGSLDLADVERSLFFFA